MRTHVALFAGLGGFVAAGNRAGLRTIFANDVEPHCIATMTKSFPDVQAHQEDIRKLHLLDHLPDDTPIDLLSGGFPCQSFSAAGSNLGFDDERGKLFFEIPRIIRELKHYPKVLLLENVSHLKAFNNGYRLNRIVQELRILGYWVSEAQALVLSSRDVSGSPQNRERLYIVAYHSSYFKKNYFNYSNFEKKKPIPLWSVVDRTVRNDDFLYLDEGSKYFQLITQSSKRHGGDCLYQIRRVGVRACPLNTCPTLTANMGGGGHNVPFLIDDYGVRKLSVSECLALQGYDLNEIHFPNSLSNKDKYTMIGNAVHAGTVEQIIKNIDFSAER